MSEDITKIYNNMVKLNDLVLKNEIVIFGSTYLANFPFYELCKKCQLEYAVYNRSILGLTLFDANEILDDCIIKIKPKKLFIQLGDEDEKNKKAFADYKNIIRKIELKLPQCQLFLIGLIGDSNYVTDFNNNLRNFCKEDKITYIDFSCNENDNLQATKIRFKKMCCFFHKSSITTSETILLSNL